MLAHLGERSLDVAAEVLLCTQPRAILRERQPLPRPLGELKVAIFQRSQGGASKLVFV